MVNKVNAELNSDEGSGECSTKDNSACNMEEDSDENELISIGKQCSTVDART